MSDASEEKLESISVYDFIAIMLDQTASIAWSKMALQPDPVSGKIEVDMDEAKVSVDLAAHLASLFEHRLDEADRRRTQNLVRDLRLNYVNKMKEKT